MTLSRAIVLSLVATSTIPPVNADLLPPFLGDFLQHLRIVPAAPAAPSVAATHLFMQTASAAMLSSEGLVLEDVPPFTQYTAFSKDGPSVGQHDNMDFMSGAFSNEDGGWLGLPQAALMGKVEGQDTVLLVQLGQPVYVPSEAKVTYTAGRVLPADPTSLALSNGALNKLLKGREGEGSPAFMSIEDAQEGFLMSECSMFIDAAYTEAQPALKPARRWLQAQSSAPAPAPSSRSGPPPLPGWFAPGGPGNPVGLANPTLRRGADTIPGYAVQQPPRNPSSTSQQASSTSRSTETASGSTEISSSNSFAGVMLVPAPAPGPGGAMRFLRLLAPAPAPLFAPAVAPQVVPADPGNPVLCMTVAGPSDCGRAAFGGVGSLGGPNQNGGSTSASGWLTNGHDIETTPSSPGGNAYSVNRYQPRGGVWGPYHGVHGRTGK
ncbi:g4968 [Coccomyxa viridis]|uniref:G4968 protein n=1 Tax=Coccomyxa viridis TaxID=1274662 RepID=A0ABP1FRL1_9CHLO